MRPTSKAFILFILFLIFVSSGTVEGSLGNGLNHIHKFQKRMREIPRKLIVVDAVLDYDYAGPNPRHDPTRKRGGNHP
ncbi:hypothetical protein H5410_017113 [Solanum commersonii]|uniref:Transmembrane protein n=1 Tax=Solanum commersonii TaxID=4109 RepID=A0A9J5ZYD5_SOLCO|nr:hypothetical protein H5410_017113 [Solanum commersonii]KAH0690121.1 hypothetical protein KY289_017479 [Solanum tuberosum]